MRSVLLAADMPKTLPSGMPPIVESRITSAIHALVGWVARTDFHLLLWDREGITSQVRAAADHHHVLDRLRVYQSRLFEESVPPALRDLPDMVWVDLDTRVSASQEQQMWSERKLRDTLLNNTSLSLSAAFFLGGGPTLVADHERYYRLVPRSIPAYVLASTGGAAAVLDQGQFYRANSPEVEGALREWTDYERLFSMLFSLTKGEER